MRWLTLLGCVAGFTAYADIRYYKCLGSVVADESSAPESQVMIRGGFEIGQFAEPRGTLSLIGAAVPGVDGFDSNLLGTREQPIEVPPNRITLSYDHAHDAFRIDARREDESLIHLQKTSDDVALTLTSRAVGDDSFSSVVGHAECVFSDLPNTDWTWDGRPSAWPYK